MKKISTTSTSTGRHHRSVGTAVSLRNRLDFSVEIARRVVALAQIVKQCQTTLGESEFPRATALSVVNQAFKSHGVRGGGQK